MPHLFVYGTLLPAARDPMGRRARGRLARESTPIGAAAATGSLYDLGRYPGLWARDGAPDDVKGYVVALTKPFLTFAWLDLYEGSEYQRLRRPVDLETGASLEAWHYLLRTKPAARIVATGDWLDVAARRSTAFKPRVSSPPRPRLRSRT